MQTEVVKVVNKATSVFIAVIATLFLFGRTTPAQLGPTDGDLERVSAGRTLAIGALSAGGQVSNLPLELYVARVLAGEGEPNAAEAAQQALAVAIRTYAVVNAGRHRREGFDLCDTTHCQVLRAANDSSRRAAMATAGRVLTLGGKPVEIFYSASCGGRSESAVNVWPGAGQFSYLRSVRDDVHEDDVPWVLDMTLEEVRQALARAGFGGDRLRDIEIDGRTSSGRVARLRLPGLRPDAIAGDPFRMAIGARMLRSTAFSMTRRGDMVHFTGVGYGHGVGMCVIGAGKRARRGESVDAILAQYYPALTVATLDGRAIAPSVAPAVTTVAEAAPVTAPVKPQSIVVHVPKGSTLPAPDLERIAVRAHESLSKALGTSVMPVTIELHETLDSFRYETGRPWWVSAAITGTTVDLAPASLLVQREGVEMTVRTAMAELLVSSAFADRPLWTRVGAARYFARPSRPAAPSRPVTCPVDAELRMAVSYAAQREAEQRAEKCFAYALARAGDWKAVR
ncbi:MAG TPA: SpoIID/LytB domain-containing protein [Vicinamibacterales bacterium]